MTLLELVELHTNQNVLSGATNKKYYSVVNTFITDTKINQVNKITNQQIINWRDKILADLALAIGMIIIDTCAH